MTLKQKILMLMIVALTLDITQAKAAEKITVGALRWTSHAASFVAYERGYFKNAGLNVKFKFFKAAQPMAIAIASGDVDFGVTATTGGLINLAGKGAIKIIGGALHEDKSIDGMMILASKKAYDAGLKTPADLKGHTFGITQTGSSFHYMAHKIAQKEGFLDSDIILKPLQKVGALIGALKTQQIDALAMVPHIAKNLIQNPNIIMIGKISDYIPDYQVTTVFTSTKNAQDRPKLVTAFLKAFSKGVADFDAALVDKTAGKKAEVAMIKLIHKYVYSDKPYDKAAPLIKNGAMRLNKGARLDLKSIQDQLDWFKSEGFVKNNITMKMLVDPQYVKTY
ncbi:ABC transporter substrate-binding protein [Sulfurospirillum sp. 1612]|uniref:ABC transporter substrate-binding protein n=1 Tax=Sulfurospirillum sp. 1612 TaxID=3094835 RepID=UPI002F923CBB